MNLSLTICRNIRAIDEVMRMDLAHCVAFMHQIGANDMHLRAMRWHGVSVFRAKGSSMFIIEQIDIQYH